jgi:hypothetical protein
VIAFFTKIPKPTGSPPPYATCMTPGGGHPASFSTSLIWFANALPSPSPITQLMDTKPFGSPDKSFTNVAVCSSVNRRGRIVSLRSSRLFSAIAVFSCCFARSISTLCWEAFASDADFCKPAKSLFALKKVDRRDVHPNPLRVSSGIVPSGSRVSHTEPSRSCLHLQRNLVRPLSLTEELRLCQNIEHYQLSILMSRAPGIHPPARCPRSVHED